MADHSWSAALFKKQPVLKCNVCGFIWQPHMSKPKVTCEQILKGSKK